MSTNNMKGAADISLAIDRVRGDWEHAEDLWYVGSRNEEGVPDEFRKRTGRA